MNVYAIRSGGVKTIVVAGSIQKAIDWYRSQYESETISNVELLHPEVSLVPDH